MAFSISSKRQTFVSLWRFQQWSRRTRYVVVWKVQNSPIVVSCQERAGSLTKGLGIEARAFCSRISRLAPWNTILRLFCCPTVFSLLSILVQRERAKIAKIHFSIDIPEKKQRLFCRLIATIHDYPRERLLYSCRVFQGGRCPFSRLPVKRISMPERKKHEKKKKRRTVTAHVCRRLFRRKTEHKISQRLSYRSNCYILSRIVQAFELNLWLISMFTVL